MTGTNFAFSDLSLSLSLSGSSSSEENHRDLPRRQQFNEAWSYLNKSARSSSRDVHSFFFFYLKRAGGGLHEYFIPLAPVPAQQPATLRAGFKKMQLHFPSGAGREGGSGSGGRGGVRNISKVNLQRPSVGDRRE